MHSISGGVDPSADIDSTWVCSSRSNTREVSLTPKQWAPDPTIYIGIKFVPGSLVWVKNQKFRAWPAMIDFNPDIDEYYFLEADELESESATWYNVTFLKKSAKSDRATVSRDWVKAEHLVPFKSLSLEDAAKRFKRSFANNDLKHLRRDIEIFERIKDWSLKDRLLHYSFTKLYTGKFVREKDLGIGTEESSPAKPKISESEIIEPKRKRFRSDGSASVASSSSNSSASRTSVSPQPPLASPLNNNPQSTAVTSVKQKPIEYDDKEVSSPYKSKENPSVFPPESAKDKDEPFQIVIQSVESLNKAFVQEKSSKNEALVPENNQTVSIPEGEANREPQRTYSTIRIQNRKIVDGSGMTFPAIENMDNFVSRMIELCVEMAKEIKPAQNDARIKPPLSGFHLVLLTVQNVMHCRSASTGFGALPLNSAISFLIKHFPYFESKELLIVRLFEETLSEKSITHILPFSADTLQRFYPIFGRMTTALKSSVKKSMRYPFLLDAMIARCNPKNVERKYYVPPFSPHELACLTTSLILDGTSPNDVPEISRYDIKMTAVVMFPFLAETSDGSKDADSITMGDILLDPVTHPKAFPRKYLLVTEPGKILISDILRKWKDKRWQFTDSFAPLEQFASLYPSLPGNVVEIE